MTLSKQIETKILTKSFLNISWEFYFFKKKKIKKDNLL